MRIPIFNFDTWREIFQTLNNYKLRTALTAFGVFWGIFMLVLLLGVGKGLENGVMRNFGGLAVNSIWVFSGETSVSYKGMKQGRDIVPNVDDLNAIKDFVPDAKYVSPQTVMRGDYTVNYHNRTGVFEVHGLYPDFRYIQAVNIIKGRFINPIDVKEKRKICIIGRRVKKALFRDDNPIGKFIKIRGAMFLVVGVVKARSIGMAADEEDMRVYVPYSTMKQTFNLGRRVGYLGIGAAEGVSANVLEKKIRNYFAQRHKFDPNDPQALGIENTEEEFNRFKNLFGAIRIFLWVVGIGTLLAGVVGVGNIMLISVRERTREIGVRIALGAQKITIISMILQEALVITLVSGYFGLVAGVGLIELVRTFDIQSEFFSDADVNMQVALGSLFILCISGLIAGYIPARKAAAIDPIVALRYE